MYVCKKSIQNIAMLRVYNLIIDASVKVVDHAQFPWLLNLSIITDIALGLFLWCDCDPTQLSYRGCSGHIHGSYYLLMEMCLYSSLLGLGHNTFEHQSRFGILKWIW